MVFGRRCYSSISSHRLLSSLVLSSSSRWCRSLLSSLKLTTQTLTTTTLPTTTDTDDDHRQHLSKLPSLLFFSSSQPDTGFLCDPKQQLDDDGDHHGGGRIQIKKQIKLLDCHEDYFCFGSSQGYLFYTPYDTPSPYSILAHNPVTGNRLHFPKSIPFRESAMFKELDYYYYLRNGGKAILSPSHDILVLTCNRGYPSFCRPLEEKLLEKERRWTTLQVPLKGGLLTDCFFHNGYLYAANHLGSIFIYDLYDGPCPDEPISSHPTAVSYPISLIESFKLGTSKYFVASPDGRDLFFVVRGMKLILDNPESTTFEEYALNPPPILCDNICPIRAKDFIVFKFFKACGKWKQVDNLGGLALFVGPSQTLSVSAHDFPTMVEPDCVYFTDDYRDMDWGGGDIGCFNVREGNIRFYKLEDGDDLEDDEVEDEDELEDGDEPEDGDKLEDEDEHEDGDVELDWPPPLWFVPTSI